MGEVCLGIVFALDCRNQSVSGTVVGRARCTRSQALSDGSGQLWVLLDVAEKEGGRIITGEEGEGSAEQTKGSLRLEASSSTELVTELTVGIFELCVSLGHCVVGWLGFSLLVFLFAWLNLPSHLFQMA